MWYQALGDNAPETLHAIFATLVPGFPSPFPGQGLCTLNRSSTSVFHDTSHGEFHLVLFVCSLCDTVSLLSLIKHTL